MYVFSHLLRMLSLHEHCSLKSQWKGSKPSNIVKLKRRPLFMIQTNFLELKIITFSPCLVMLDKHEKLVLHQLNSSCLQHFASNSFGAPTYIYDTAFPN